MNTLRKRMQKFEVALATKREQHQQLCRRLAREALPFWSRELELLVSAFTAVRIGRELSEPEAAAKQAFREQLVRGCNRPDYPSIEECEAALDWEGIRMRLVSAWMSPDQLNACIRGLEALQIGQSITSEQEEALEAYAAALKRFKRLVDFDGSECAQTEATQ